MPEPPAADASPIIILAQGGQLDLLRAVAPRIVIPARVAAENRRPSLPDAATHALDTASWLQIVETGPVPPVIRRFRLGSGEEAVLTWAWSHPGAAVIIDELRGRRAARRLGIPVIGMLGIILEGKRAGLIPAARPIVTHLLQVTDWFLAPDIVARALELIGE